MGVVQKSAFSAEGAALRRWLVATRKCAGLTQPELAARLRRVKSFVARLELGERRLDVAEFLWLCEACGINPETAAVDLIRTMRSARRRTKGAKRRAKDAR